MMVHKFSHQNYIREAASFYGSQPAQCDAPTGLNVYAPTRRLKLTTPSHQANTLSKFEGNRVVNAP